MKALIFDKAKNNWENSRGFDLVDVPTPEIQNPDDVIIKVHYAGVCGSDKGIWYRQAFRDQILGSMDAGHSHHPDRFAVTPPLAGGKLTTPSRPPKADGHPSSPTPSPPPAETPPRAGGEKEGIKSPPFKGGVPAEGGGGGKTYRIIGHEFFGEIMEAGAEVAKKYKLKKGDFVTCESHVVCNQCYQCLRGEKHVCMQEKILGISYDGGFAEYVKIPGHIVWKTDTSKIRPEVAAVQEPFGNAVHAASKVDLKGKTVAIFGLGPIGLFLLLVAKGMGAKEIIGVEPNPIAIEMAKKLGIDYIIPLPTTPSRLAGHPSLTKEGIEFSSPPKLGGVPRAKSRGEVVRPYAHNLEVIDEIMKITNNVGVDVSFEMAGFNNSFNNAIFATRRGGEVILFGIKTGDFVLEDYNRLIVRGLTLHAVIGRQIWKTWEATRKLLEDPKNKIQEQIYKVILNEGRGTILPISEYTKGRFEKMITEHPKILLQF